MYDGINYIVASQWIMSSSKYIFILMCVCVYVRRERDGGIKWK